MLDLVIFENPVRRWLLALLVTAAVLAGVALWRWVVTHRLRPLALRTNTFFDDAATVLAETTAPFLVLLIALYAGSLLLVFPADVKIAARAGAIIVALLQAGIWGSALIRSWVTRYDEQHRASNAAGVGTARLLGLLLRIVLYSLVLLLILDNIPGVEVTALVASLGIGGVAVALATQNILSDIFASLSIALDKPFVVGDTIAVRDDVGTVEQIGLKTTRLRSISGEQLVFANGDLLSTRIRNFARQEQRRVVFTFRVPYGTSPQLLRAIPEQLRAIITPIEQVRFDRAHFMRFDDLGLQFEVVYFLDTPDFNRSMDVQQQINLALLEQLEAAGVGFASLAEPLETAARTTQSLNRVRQGEPFAAQDTT